MIFTVIYYVAGATQQWMATQCNMPVQIDLCGMLRLSMYDGVVYVNAAVEINELDYNVTVVRSVNGVLV